MKSISSIPGALLFRSTFVIVLGLILVLIFFSYTNDVNERVNNVVLSKNIHEINIALAFRLYQAAATGNLKELSDLHLKNPFKVLIDENYKKPSNYIGEIASVSAVGKTGWYYNTSTREIFFWDGRSTARTYQLQFIFKSFSKSDRYEPKTDMVEKLHMARTG